MCDTREGGDYPPYDTPTPGQPTRVPHAGEPQAEAGNPPLVHARALLAYDRVSIIPVVIPPARKKGAHL